MRVQSDARRAPTMSIFTFLQKRAIKFCNRHCDEIAHLIRYQWTYQKKGAYFLQPKIVFVPSVGEPLKLALSFDNSLRRFPHLALLLFEQTMHAKME